MSVLACTDVFVIYMHVVALVHVGVCENQRFLSRCFPQQPPSLSYWDNSSHWIRTSLSYTHWLASPHSSGQPAHPRPGTGYRWAPLFPTHLHGCWSSTSMLAKQNITQWSIYTVLNTTFWNWVNFINYLLVILVR